MTKLKKMGLKKIRMKSYDMNMQIVVLLYMRRIISLMKMYK